MLACELRLAGVETVVFDRLPDRRPHPPGIGLNAASVELLERRGLLDTLREHTMPLPVLQFAMMMLDNTSYPERDQPVVLLQSHLEAALQARALELGADIRRHHEVTSVAQDDDGVIVGLNAAGASRSERFRFLVGCDGADSTVRLRAGIGATSASVPFRGITGEVETSFADLAGLPIGGAYFPAGGQWMCLPTGPDVFRITTSEFGIDPDEPAAPVTMDELRSAVARLTGGSLGAARPRWLERTDCRLVRADRHRHGNVFLAGDAATLIFPLNGLALNNALHDAANLGWKLGAVIAGWAPSGLLDTYAAERGPAKDRVVHAVDAQVRLCHAEAEAGGLRALFTELLSLDDVARHLAGMLSGDDVRYDLGIGSGKHPLQGAVLPPGLLKSTNGALEQAMRAGRPVLADLTESGAWDGAVTGWADRVQTVAARAEYDTGAGALLVRPDGHVAWVGVPGQSPEDLRAALARWFGRQT
jgi:2-polyprenyl-6-methoxyphenol hydroxylase-like FAD-dependent oxidoreductase